MNLVPIFESFESHTLTVLKKESGDPWFLAKCLAAPLGVGRDSIRHQIADLEASDKDVISIHTPGGPQKMTFVSESGALQIIVQSRKPEARRLRKWICDLAVRYAKGEVVEAANNYVTRDELNAAIGPLVVLMQGLTQAVQALVDRTPGSRRGLRPQSDLPVWSMAEHHRMRRMGYTRTSEWLAKELGTKPPYGKASGLAIRASNYSSQNKVPVHRFRKGSGVLVYVHGDTVRRVHRTGWTAKTATLSEAQMDLFGGGQ